MFWFALGDALGDFMIWPPKEMLLLDVEHFDRTEEALRKSVGVINCPFAIECR